MPIKKSKTLEDKRLDKIQRELDKLFKYIPAQRTTIAKNRGSKGWGRGYTAAYGARKALRKAGRSV